MHHNRLLELIINLKLLNQIFIAQQLLAKRNHINMTAHDIDKKNLQRVIMKIIAIDIRFSTLYLS